MHKKKPNIYLVRILSRWEFTSVNFLFLFIFFHSKFYFYLVDNYPGECAQGFLFDFILGTKNIVQGFKIFHSCIFFFFFWKVHLTFLIFSFISPSNLHLRIKISHYLSISSKQQSLKNNSQKFDMKKKQIWFFIKC